MSFESLCVSKHLAVIERDLQLGVLAMKVMLEAVEIAGTLPFAHWQVVK